MLSELGVKTLAELEALYAEDRPVRPPRGRFEGKLLRWLDTPPARHPLWRPLLALMFAASPFGVDFDARCWFFGGTRFQAGRFEPRAGLSRFRDAPAIGLHYQSSRLPGPIKALLYDEVKPLSEDLCLGLGGLVRAGKPEPVFFFELRRVASR
jgi:hypothetical protein